MDGPVTSSQFKLFLQSTTESKRLLAASPHASWLKQFNQSRQQGSFVCDFGEHTYNGIILSHLNRVETEHAPVLP